MGATDLNRTRKILLGISAATGIGVVAYLLYNFAKAQTVQVTLTTEPSLGGKICVGDDPSGCIANTFSFNNGDLVKLTAVPDSGYYLDEWKLDGVPKGNNNPFYLYMWDSYTITALFTTTPPPPPPVNPVVAIYNQTTPLSPTIKQRYKGFWFWLNSEEEFNVIPVIDYLGTTAIYSQQTITVKAVDAYNAPVPYATLLVYSSPVVDSMEGTIFIGNSRAHGSISYPAIEVITNKDGIASFPITYRHTDLNGFSKERCYNWREYLFNEYVECLAIGKRLPVCDVLLNGCISEINGIAFNNVCPNATQYGPEYEYESIQAGQQIIVQWKDNPSVATAIANTCYFGIKNLG